LVLIYVILLFNALSKPLSNDDRFYRKLSFNDEEFRDVDAVCCQRETHSYLSMCSQKNTLIFIY